MVQGLISPRVELLELNEPTERATANQHNDPKHLAPKHAILGCSTKNTNTIRVKQVQTKNPRKQQKAASAVAPLILLLIGLVILLYPVLASQVNNHSQQVVVDEYRKLLQSVPKNDLNQAILEAQLYNQVLSSTPMLEPWPARVAEDNPGYQNYLSKLSVFPMMGTLEIPSIDVNLPIYHGTTDETLDKGIGHLFGTDLPVGGVGTHAVITGHTGLPYATMLDRLVDVQKGDTFSIYVAGEHLLYQVREIKVVSPEDVESLFPVPDKDLLTVVTCTPYGVNSHRLLVTGERIELPDGDSSKAPPASGLVWQPWMIGVIIAVVLAVAYAVLRVVKKNRKQEEADHE